MKKTILKLLSVFMVVSVFAGCFASSTLLQAKTNSEILSEISKLEQESKKIESQIKNLESQKTDQAALKAAIQSKIANTQRQIDICNGEINSINAKIAANKADIDKKNQQIETDKQTFKKRLRAIYMSNTGSNVQVLLGAENFSDFLQLSQLTASVSAHDKVMIEKIVAAIEVLQAKQAENEKLLQDQVAVRQTVQAKQSELEAENAKIQSVINSISSNANSLDKQNDKIENNIEQLQKDYKRQTQSFLSSASNSNLILANGNFIWPVPGYYYISAGYASNDAVHNGRHYGIDIAGSGISGKPVLAIADGYVTRSNSGASVGDYSAGGGYGNYVQIDHGKLDGKTYGSIYGHMSSIAVSAGASVKQGQVVGYVGTTGWSTGYHLHLGIMINGAWVNPMNFYSKVK